jgi:hypothetical protein
MSWFPIGQDFVFSVRPSHIQFRRLLRRNEHGSQGIIVDITVDQQNPDIIFVAHQIKRSINFLGL